MTHSKEQQTAAMPPGDVDQHLRDLKLSCIAEHSSELAKQAAQKQWSPVDSLSRLIEGEAHLRCDRATKNRLRMARVPVLNTLDQFRWDWPTQMNRLQVQNHFRLSFIKDKANLIYLGGVGLGKTPLATALGSTACLKGSSVLCASAIDVINTLAAAKSADRLTQELKTYTKPALLRLDELGYLPIDKAGADLLFQVISLRYEQGSLMITSNRALKEWPKMFNHASTLTSALLDRLLHHAETVIIEGNSFRMRGKLEHEARLHQVSPEVPYGEPGGILPHLVSTHIFQPPIFQHFHAVGNTSLSCYKGFCRKFSFESIWGMISLCESR